MIDQNNKSLSIRVQCALLNVCRSTIYYQSKDSPNAVMIANEIYEIWSEMPYYGYRKITKELQRRGYEINHKKVLKMMQEMRITALYPKPKTSILSRQHKKYPYLLRNVKIERPNQAWKTDITYIKICGGYIYLIAIIDVFSRFIVSWAVSVTMEVDFCLEALDKALFHWQKPEILNSDQGSQFTSLEWTERLEKNDIKISMDGVRRWADNIYIERFWRTIKYEYIFLHNFSTVKEAKSAIDRFINEYNYRRLHQSLEYQTPSEVYLKSSIL